MRLLPLVLILFLCLACKPGPVLPGDAPCEGADCVSTGCGAGQQQCGSACVDLYTSSTDCGACGVACTAPHATGMCSFGQCTLGACLPGFGDCDGLQSNGCEADLSSPDTCGLCTNRCAPAEAGAASTCEAGVCQVKCLPGYRVCGGSCQATCEAWKWTNPLPAPSSIFGATFWDTSLGLAAGERIVYRTADGGKTWTTATSLIDYVEAIRFTSATHVVATGFDLIGAHSGGTEGFAMYSDDAGLTWTKVKLALPLGVDPRDLAFDGDKGALVGIDGSGGFVLTTTDGGKTWTQKLSFAPPKTDAGFSAFSAWFHGVALRGNHLWVVGDDGIRLSADFGATWSRPGAGPGKNLNGVAFATDLLGLAVDGDGKIWRTTNAGTTWVEVSPGGQGWLKRVSFFADGVHAIAGGYMGIVYRSSDSGLTWTSAVPDPLTYVFAVPTAGSSVWTAGTRGVVYRSDDYGATWTRKTAGVARSIAAMSFPDSKHGFAVGELGVILATDDTGDSWRPVLPWYPPYLADLQSNMLSNALRDVSFASASEGWAVGDPVKSASGMVTADAVILHTRDSGLNWELQASGTRASLRGVGFSSPIKGWAVGMGVVLRTVNGGQSWVQQPSLTASLVAVAVVSDTEAWACEMFGTLYHTVDSGQTWTGRGTGLGTLWGMRFTADRRHGIVSGTTLVPDPMFGSQAKVAFAITHDGGATWSTVVTGIDAFSLNAVFAPDGMNGISGNIDGKVLRTRDGGKTWTLDTQPSLETFYDAVAVDGSFLLSTHFGGILKGPVAPLD